MTGSEKSFRSPAWIGALESGAMDLPGMDELKATYLDLARSLCFPLPGKIPAAKAAEVKMRLTEGFLLGDPSAMTPSPGELARRVALAAGILAKRAEDGEKGAAARAAADPGKAEGIGRAAQAYLEKGEEGLRGGLLALNPPIDPEVGSFVAFNALKGGFLGLGALFAQEDLTPWTGAGCPVCAGTPALGVMEGEGGRRRMVCHRCETRWPFPRITCPYCGNDDHKLLGYLSLGGEGSDPASGGPRIRLDTCDACKSYLKVVDLRVGQGDFPEVEDLLTPRHDLAASRQGYTRGGPNIFGVRLGGNGGL